VINESTGAKVEGGEGHKFGNVFLTKKEGGGEMGRWGRGEEPYTKGIQFLGEGRGGGDAILRNAKREKRYDDSTERGIPMECKEGRGEFLSIFVERKERVERKEKKEG
jgi:hypothetical protein